LSKASNLIGIKFNKLTVIKRVENNKRGESQWLCKCDCKLENEVIVVGSRLRSGNTKSCGCLQKEKAIQLGKSKKKYNTYDLLSEEYGVGYASNTNELFYFDLEDYDKIKDYCWYNNDDGYIATNIKYSDTYCTVRMHRLVMNCPDDMDVDHIFHNTCDNRKEFLRIVTESQNQMNQKIRINNATGVAGVILNNNKWRARIRINNKDIHLGYFINKEDAIHARKEAEEKYFGEYAFKNI